MLYLKLIGNILTVPLKDVNYILYKKYLTMLQVVKLYFPSYSKEETAVVLIVIVRLGAS